MANTYPEPYRSAKKDALIDPSTCYNRECTSYCAWKIKEATGKWPKRTGDMNARNWIYRLPENGYGTTTSTPNGNKCVGVSTRGKYGHVVWSEGTLHISEYNWDSKGNYSERNVNANNYRWYIIKSAPSGFLPSRGYWKYGDKDARIGQMARFMRDKFPASIHTSRSTRQLLRPESTPRRERVPTQDRTRRGWMRRQTNTRKDGAIWIQRIERYGGQSRAMRGYMRFQILAD